jgi:hypothetical protein
MTNAEPGSMQRIGEPANGGWRSAPCGGNPEVNAKYLSHCIHRRRTLSEPP